MPESVVAFKGVKVSGFNGRSLSLLSSGTMTVDPDIEEAHKLKGWYDAQGRSDTFTSYTSTGAAMGSGGRTESFKTIAQVREEQLGMSDQPDYFTLKVTIVYIKPDNLTYPACASGTCNKKVTELDPGQWRCEKCDKTFPQPQHRYIMLMNVSDHTGQLWLSCFDEVGKLVMGVSANELVEAKEENEHAAEEIMRNANCRTWIFRCRAKTEYFGDQQRFVHFSRIWMHILTDATRRMRYQVASARPVNYSEEASRLAEVIKSYSLA